MFSDLLESHSRQRGGKTANSKAAYEDVSQQDGGGIRVALLSSFSEPFNSFNIIASRIVIEIAKFILSITLLSCEMSIIVQSFEYSLALPFFGNGMKTDLFQSCGHC